MKLSDAEADEAILSASRDGDHPISNVKIAIGVAVVLVLAGLYWWLWRSGALEALGNEQVLQNQVQRLGIWGPLGIIVLMTAAIVMSPIPSGPIALVAGAAFGPGLGRRLHRDRRRSRRDHRLSIARCLGYEAVRRWARAEPMLKRLSQRRSQNWLMAIVFASRLVPFISFDAVSYAAGLTPLAFCRFALATLAGVIPISFVLAYFGEELLTADPGRMMIVAVLVGGITLLPIGIKLLWNWYAGE